MPDRRRTITLSVNDDFSRQLKAFVTHMDAAEHSAQTFSHGTKGFFQAGAENLFYMANAAREVYGAFSRVFSTANQWADMGKNAMRSEYALGQLAGSAKEASAWIQAVQDAALGSVTKGEAAAQAYQLMRFGLADSAEAARDFVRDISIVATANPQLGDTAEAINQLQLTLSNMSFMRLDQLGISAGVVRKRMAELKKETAGLTTEQAFQQAVMEQVGQQADILGDSILQVDDAQKRLEARFRGFKEGLGKEIAEGFEGAAEAVDGFYASLNAGFTMGDFTAEGARQAGKKGNLVETIAFLTATQLAAFYGAGQTKPGQEITLTSPMIPKATPAEVLDVSQLYPFGLAPGGYGGDVTRNLQATTNAQRQRAFWWQQKPVMASLREGGALSDQDWQAFTQQYNMDIASAYWGTDLTGWDKESWYDYRKRAQESTAARYGQWRTGQLTGAGMETRGGIPSQVAGPGGMKPQFEALQTAIPIVTDLFSTMTGTVQDAARALFTLGDGFEEVNSLAEKFGLGAGAFQVDVLREMKDALQDAGVSQDQYNETVAAYEHLTGLANAQSAAYDTQLRSISEAFAAGELTQLEYLNALNQITNADLSGLNWLTVAFQADPSTLELYNEILGKMGDPAFAQAAAQLPQNIMGMAQEGFGTFASMLFGGAPAAGGQEGGARDDATTQAMQGITDAISTQTGLWTEDFTAFTTTSTEQMKTLETESVTSIDNIGNSFEQLDGKQATLIINISTPDMLNTLLSMVGAQERVPQDDVDASNLRRGGR